MWLALLSVIVRFGPGRIDRHEGEGDVTMYPLSAEDRLLLATQRRTREAREAAHAGLLRRRAPSVVRTGWAQVVGLLDLRRTGRVAMPPGAATDRPPRPAGRAESATAPQG